MSLASRTSRRTTSLAVLSAAAVFGLMAVAGPIPALSLLAIAAISLTLVLRPHWSIYACIIIAFTALPNSVPRNFALGGFTIYGFEPFLFFAVIWLLFTTRFTRSDWWVVLPLAASIALPIGLGLLNGNPPAKMVYDARPYVEMGMAAFVGIRMWQTPAARGALKVALFSLSVSAIVTFGGAIGLLSVGSRDEQAALDTGQGVSEAAVRLLTSATSPALAALCAGIGIAIVYGRKASNVLGLVVPSALIVLLSFSRNSILGVGAAVAFTVIAALSLRVVGRAALTIGAVLLLGTLLMFSAPVLNQLPGGAWINEQVASYSSRVIEGLQADVQARDSSVIFRAQETAYLGQSIAQSPYFGHGFGHAYKPAEGFSSFARDFAPYYAHNFYLWMWAKAGLIGLGAFCIAFGYALVRAVRTKSPLALGLGAATAALLAISVVAPQPLGTTSAVLLGGLAGLLANSPGQAKQERRGPIRPGPG